MTKKEKISRVVKQKIIGFKKPNSKDFSIGKLIDCEYALENDGDITYICKVRDIFGDLYKVTIDEIEFIGTVEKKKVINMLDESSKKIDFDVVIAAIDNKICTCDDIVTVCHLKDLKEFLASEVL